MRLQTLFCIGLSLPAWLAISPAQTGGGYDASWSAVIGGGMSTNSNWSVVGALGQGSAGKSTNASWAVQGGYWNRVTGNLTPVAHIAAFSRPKNLPFKIRIPNLLTNSTDPDGETLALASTDAASTNGASMSADSNYVYYTPPGTNGNVSDRFVYRVKDGFQGLAAGTVVLTIVDSEGQSFSITDISTLPDGNKRIYFAGIPNRAYWIQATTNLTPPVSWVTLSTNVAGGDGLWSYVDSQATNFGSRYYRSAAP